MNTRLRSSTTRQGAMPRLLLGSVAVAATLLAGLALLAHWQAAF